MRLALPGKRMLTPLPANALVAAAGPVTSPPCPCVMRFPVCVVALSPVQKTVSPTTKPPGSGGGFSRLSSVR